MELSTALPATIMGDYMLNFPVSSGTTNYHYINNYTDEQDDEEQRFKKVVAFNGLKILEVVEEEDGFHILCDRRGKQCTLRIWLDQIELTDSNGDILFRMVKHLPKVTSTISNWTIYDSNTGGYTSASTNI
jgi:hypothetical protein